MFYEKKPDSLLSASNKGNNLFFLLKYLLYGKFTFLLALILRVINNCFLMLKLGDRLEKKIINWKQIIKDSFQSKNSISNLSLNRPVQTTRWWLAHPHVAYDVAQLWAPVKRLRWDVRKPSNLYKKYMSVKFPLIYCFC